MGGVSRAFAIRGSGIYGSVFTCTLPQKLLAASATAEARVYVAQSGWHNNSATLRVWADMGDRQVSLLPQCADEATRDTVDVLGLRAQSATPGAAYTGAPLAAGDPALLADSWEWKTLSVALGEITGEPLRICVGLQSRGGDEAVFVDRLRLSFRQNSHPAGCAPSPLLTGADSFASLAVPGSCSAGSGGTRTGPVLVVLCFFLGGATVIFLARGKLRKMWRGSSSTRSGTRSLELEAWPVGGARPPHRLPA